MSDLYDDTDIVSESDMDDKDKEDDLSLNEREYVKPPSYRAEHVEDVPLILRLKSRIHADLHQINGVYDSQIQDAEKRKIKKIKEIEKEHSNKILYINLKQIANLIFQALFSIRTKGLSERYSEAPSVDFLLY